MLPWPPIRFPSKTAARSGKKIAELRQFSKDQGLTASQDAARLEAELVETRRTLYATLTPWQKVMVARHPRRPYTRDYIAAFVRDFTELHGDRLLADDLSIVGGMGWIGEHPVMVIGTQKGRDTKSNLACNFGCPYPEGYRKALRLMRLAAKFNRPIVCFIDTPGAFPGIEGEERHVAEAIAVNLREMFRLAVPIIAVVIGEGGSGGAGHRRGQSHPDSGACLLFRDFPKLRRHFVEKPLARGYRCRRAQAHRARPCGTRHCR